ARVNWKGGTSACHQPVVLIRKRGRKELTRRARVGTIQTAVSRTSATLRGSEPRSMRRRSASTRAGRGAAAATSATTGAPTATSLPPRRLDAGSSNRLLEAQPADVEDQHRHDRQQEQDRQRAGPGV